MSPEQIREMSVVRVERPDTYDEDGYPIEEGLMDSRMGVIDPSLKCPICGEKGGKCQGHFGMVELARPVIHIGFADDIYKILSIVFILDQIIKLLIMNLIKENQIISIISKFFSNSFSDFSYSSSVIVVFNTLLRNDAISSL